MTKKTSEKIPTNEISKYLWKVMKELRPDDNINQLALRTGIPRNTLWNRFFKSKDWDQAILLMVICGDIGITMEEALVCSRIPNAQTEIYEKFKMQIQKLSIELEKIKSENKKLKTTLDKIKKSFP